MDIKKYVNDTLAPVLGVADTWQQKTGKSWSEVDVLMVIKAGMVYEYEIKTNRSDFKGRLLAVDKWLILGEVAVEFEK